MNDTPARPRTRKVDVLVPGSGDAGKYLAWHMAQSGKRTVLIERRWVGGSCPNVNCLPSKNEVHSAKVAHNERLETSAPNIWAMGDCAGSSQFTHAAYDDHRVIRDNLAGGRRTTEDRLIPWCMFTDPPLAHVGLNEKQAQQRGIAVRVVKLQAREILRTRTTGEPRGFLKALVDANSDQILGFTMFAADAGEVLATVQAAMMGKLPYQTLRDAIFTHPTMAEGLNALFAGVPARHA